MPLASRITDDHGCPVHGGGPVVTGCATVLSGYERAARVGDELVCPPGTDVIADGEPTVIVGGQRAARIGDPTEAGGLISQGCPTVTIGGVTQVLATDKPFVEDCELKKKNAERRAARGQ